MKTCAFITLGCKVNQYESQAVREMIIGKGYVEVAPDKKADLYVINTCTVTAVSDTKSRRHVRRVQRINPDAKVIVTGCYAEAYANDVSDGGAGGNVLVVEQNKKAEIGRFAGDGSGVNEGEGVADTADSGSIFDLSINRFSGHTRAFVKIEDGCDNMCSYCIVPYVRGGVRSRPVDDVENEVRRLVENGYTEIALTGIHLGAYGKDLEARDGGGLITVLRKLEKITGLRRIRISSLESYEVTEDLISMVADSERICPHFHLPIQSGDDYILGRMNRRYSVNEYLSLLDAIRSRIELPSLTTDVIVGFPGEEDAHFNNTVITSRRAGFSRVHVFPYSVRSGTAAAKMKDRCSVTTIGGRRRVMGVVADELAMKYRENFAGKRLEVLVESRHDGEDGGTMLCGYTERYVKVVFGGGDDMVNRIVTVRAKDIGGGHVTGEVDE